MGALGGGVTGLAYFGGLHPHRRLGCDIRMRRPGPQFNKSVLHLVLDSAHLSGLNRHLEEEGRDFDVSDPDCSKVYRGARDPKEAVELIGPRIACASTFHRSKNSRKNGVITKERGEHTFMMIADFSKRISE